MKKFVAFLLVFVITFSFVACSENTDEKESSVVESTISADNNTSSKAIIDEALALVTAGKNKEAYSLLYKNRSDAAVQEMLGDFRVYWTNAIETNSDVQTIYECSYDQNGMQTKNTKKYSDTGSQTTTWLNTYDSAGRLIKVVKMADDFQSSVIEYKYDSTDRIVSIITETFYEIGWQSNKETVTRTFDDKGRVSEESFSSEIREMNYRYFYAENDKIVKYICNIDGHESTTEFTYNEKDNLEKVIRGGEVASEWIYDINGNVIKKIEGGNIGEYKYNENNLLVEEKISYDFGLISTYKYSYDDNGQIIQDQLEASRNMDAPIVTEYSDFVYFYCPDAVLLEPYIDYLSNTFISSL